MPKNTLTSAFDTLWPKSSTTCILIFANAPDLLAPRQEESLLKAKADVAVIINIAITKNILI